MGDTWKDVEDGASVAVSPDRRMVAVTSGLATTVLDTRTREEIARMELPPDGHEDPDGGLTAGTVWSAAWTKDGARLLLGAEGAVRRVDRRPGREPRRRHRRRGHRDLEEVDRVAIDVIPDDIELDPSGRFLAAVSPHQF